MVHLDRLYDSNFLKGVFNITNGLAVKVFKLLSSFFQFLLRLYICFHILSIVKINMVLESFCEEDLSKSKVYFSPLFTSF